jgi:hypothetical protein
VRRFTCFLSCAALACVASTAHAQIPHQINYQGRLVQGTNLVSGNVALSLRLYDAPSGGTLLYEDSNTVSAVDGVYATVLGDGTTFGILTNALTNSAVYLEAMVNGTALAPRERIMAVPFALRALDAGLKGYAERGTFDQAPVASGSDTVAHGYGAVASGLRSTVGGGYSNSATQAGATVAGGQLNRATGPQASALGGINNEAFGFASTIAGGANNRASSLYSTIGGGEENAISNTHATIAGGNANQAHGYVSAIGGGYDNRVMADNSTVAGGWGNRALTAGSTIGGGYNNFSYGNDSTIAGGNSNFTTNNYATVGGGLANRAHGQAATIPGGSANETRGDYSFAAGRQALANHAGSFVWADAAGSNFASTASNQFAVRANGGVRIQGTAAIGVTTSAPQMGFAYVSSQSGNPILFQHPTTNLYMQWIGTQRVLRVYNTNTAAYFDAKINLTYHPSGAEILGVILDINLGEHVALTNSGSLIGGWDVAVTPEGFTGPGFIFTGNSYDDNISGLVTYWQ